MSVAKDAIVDRTVAVHASDRDLERYHLGTIRDRRYLAMLGKHLLECPVCTVGAEQAQERIKAIRARLNWPRKK
jgi:hypothetical protein